MGDDAARVGVKRRTSSVHRAPFGVALLTLALACVDARPARHVAGYDADSHFMTIEADATSFRFSAVSATGQQVDSGVSTAA